MDVTERAQRAEAIRNRIADILCALKWGAPSEAQLRDAGEKVEQAVKILERETAVRGAEA